MKDKAVNDAMNSIENRVRHVYNQGFEDGKDYYIQKHDNAYNKGLEDAWECARKILFDSSLSRDILTDLGADSFCGIIHDCSADEAIAKLKEYEEQQKQSEKSCKNCKHGINGMLNFKSGRCEACYYDERIGGNCLFEEKQTEEKTDKSCDNCRFVDLTEHEFPCCDCFKSHTFRWEPQEGTENRGVTDYQKYINALRKCAKEHKNDKTFTGHIIVSDLCRDTANLLEELEHEPKQKTGRWIAGEYWSMGSGMGESYGYWYTCSECGNKIRGGYSECGDNYCSKCGAKMSEESKS